jgi:hypothetical protein
MAGPRTASVHAEEYLRRRARPDREGLLPADPDGPGERDRNREIRSRQAASTSWVSEAPSVRPGAALRVASRVMSVPLSGAFSCHWARVISHRHGASGMSTHTRSRITWLSQRPRAASL